MELGLTVACIFLIAFNVVLCLVGAADPEGRGGNISLSFIGLALLSAVGLALTWYDYSKTSLCLVIGILIVTFILIKGAASGDD